MLKFQLPKRTVIAIVIAVAALGVLGIVGYYWYEGTHYVSTEDARVAADTVTVTPEISGKLLQWQVREGDTVKAGDVIGQQDLGAALTYGITLGAINPQSMTPVAGMMADKAEIKAPITGQVIQSSAVVGEMAASGMSLAVIADTADLYVSANIKEGFIRSVHPGELVDVRIDAYPGRDFQGRVENLGRATTSTFSLLPSQNDSGNYTKVTQVIPVKIHLLETGDAQLMAGMNATVKIHIK
ncbi:MAG: efflux RND transporter periplasmic adaptor subunit [Thermacetogeniaceae bacterium]